MIIEGKDLNNKEKDFIHLGNLKKFFDEYVALELQKLESDLENIENVRRANEREY